MKPFKPALTGLVLMFVGNSAMADVTLADGGVSGEWFNAGRSGEGIFVEIVETSSGGNAIAAAWFTFDEAGNQMWLVGNQVLDSSQTSVTIDVSRYDGPVFGPGFDSGDLNAMPWGTLTLRFPNCDSAVLNYSSTDGFGSGQINMIRLTDLEQVSCTDPAAPPPSPALEITPGLWTGDGVCFFVNAEGTQIVESDQCDSGKSFSAQITGVEINLDSNFDPDNAALCDLDSACVGAWDIVTETTEQGLQIATAKCANDAGGIGRIGFSTGNEACIIAFTAQDLGGGICFADGDYETGESCLRSGFLHAIDQMLVSPPGHRRPHQVFHHA